MSASGNVRTTQVRSGDRSGTGSKLGTVTGTLTVDKQLKFDSDGNIVASSTDIGGTSSGTSFFSETDPPTTSWTWVNQNSSVVSTVRNKLAFQIPQKNGTGSSVYYRSLPGSTFTLIAKLSANIKQVDFYHHGIILFETGSSKAVFVGFGIGSSFGVRYGEWSDLANIGSTVDVAFGISAAQNMQIYFKLQQDSSNIIASYGDGNSFYTLATIGKTAFITADAMGLLFNKNNATGTYDYPTLLSWATS